MSFGSAGYYNPRTGEVSSPNRNRAVQLINSKPRRSVVEKTSMPCLFLGGQEEGRHHNVPLLGNNLPLEFWQVLEKEPLPVMADFKEGAQEKTIQVHIYTRVAVCFPHGEDKYVYIWDVLESITENLIKRAVEEELL